MKPIDGDLNPTHLLAHDRYLRRLVRSLLVDEHEVDDVLQQTWMSAIEGGPSRPAALRGWLARVARNFALKRRRAEGRRQAHTEAAARPERIPSTVDVLAREAARKSVVDAVLTLAEPYRSTTILRYLEGQPPREVAKRLGVPVETVRTRVRHALGLLRAELDRRNGGDREAWCVALLPLCALEKSSAVGAAAPLKATVAAGVFMATKLKIAIAAIVLVLVALAMWHWTGRPGSRVVGSGNSQHEVASSSARPAGAAARPDLPAAGDASIAPAVTANSSTHETGLVVHLTWESDQTPAAGVGLRIVPADIADGFLDTRWATTDASGTARVSGLPAGAVDIYQDRGYAVVRAAIVSGATTETTMKAAAGVDVEGMVVDAADRPVDGAEIWVYPDSDDLLWGQPVTRSKSDGTFQIHAVARKAYIGARSPSHSPSEFVPVFTERGVRTTNMRLVLPGRGGEIVGRVCGPDGEPVAGALVVIGEDETAGPTTPSTTQTEDPSERGPSGGFEQAVSLSDFYPERTSVPLVTTTDDHGAFRAASVAPGSTRVAARARGFASWEGAADVIEGGSAPMQIRLTRGMNLLGSVTDEEGKPVGGASIRVERGSEFFHAQCKSASDGTYRLDGLAPGYIVATADEAHEGRACASLEGAGGDEVRWDPRLSNGLKLVGRVMDAAGAPLVGWKVKCFASDDVFCQESGVDMTDACGRFVIRRCRKVPYRVAASLSKYGDERWPVLYSIVADRVVPGSSEVVLRADASARESATIIGVVLDPDGRPAIGAVGVMNRDLGSGTSVETDETGRFRVGPLPPTSFEVTIKTDGFPEVKFDARKLEPDATWDLGTIQLERAGFIVARLEHPDPIVGAFWLQVESDTNRWIGENPRISSDVARSGPLSPGHYVLRAFGDHVTSAAYPVEVRVLEESRVTVVLRTGASVWARFPEQDGIPLSNDVHVVIRDEAGDVVDDRHIQHEEDGDILSGVFSLAVGKYRVEATADTGRQARASLEITRQARPFDAFFFPLR